MFDCKGFIDGVLKQDPARIRACFAEDAVVN